MQSLERAFAILDLLRKDSPAELSLKEIGDATGLHASTACHLVATMVQCSYIAQDPGTRRYIFGAA